MLNAAIHTKKIVVDEVRIAGRCGSIIWSYPLKLPDLGKMCPHGPPSRSEATITMEGHAKVASSCTNARQIPGPREAIVLSQPC
jgi:hypothetical protein